MISNQTSGLGHLDTKMESLPGFAELRTKPYQALGGIASCLFVLAPESKSTKLQETSRIPFNLPCGAPKSAGPGFLVNR